MGLIGDQRSMNLTRTREQGQTEVPTCMEPLSCWRERVVLQTVSSITGESVNFIVSELWLARIWTFGLTVDQVESRTTGDWSLESGVWSVVLCSLTRCLALLSCRMGEVLLMKFHDKCSEN